MKGKRLSYGTIWVERYGVIETPSSVWKTEVLTVKLIAQIARDQKVRHVHLTCFPLGIAVQSWAKPQ